MASHCCSLDPDETKRLEPGNLVKVGDRKLVKLAKMVPSIIYHTQFIWLGILLCFGSPRKMFREYSNDSSGFLPRFFLETHLPAPKSTSIAVKSGIFRVKFLPFRFPSLLQMNLFFTVSWFSFFSSTYNFFRAGGLFRTLAADLLSTAAALQRKPSGCPVQSALLRGGSTTCLRRNVPRGTQGMAVHLVIHQNGFLWNLNIDSS